MQPNHVIRFQTITTRRGRSHRRDAADDDALPCLRHVLPEHGERDEVEDAAQRPRPGQSKRVLPKRAIEFRRRETIDESKSSATGC